jgi:hypothetical protein
VPNRVTVFGVERALDTVERMLDTVDRMLDTVDRGAIRSGTFHESPFSDHNDHHRS